VLYLDLIRVSTSLFPSPPLGLTFLSGISVESPPIPFRTKFSTCLLRTSVWRLLVRSSTPSPVLGDLGFLLFSASRKAHAVRHGEWEHRIRLCSWSFFLPPSCIIPAEPSILTRHLKPPPPRLRINPLSLFLPMLFVALVSIDSAE